MSEITPVTHTEKVVAGEVTPVTHLEKVIAKYGGGNVYESLEAGTNILIEETADGKAKISASGEVSSEDTVARAEIAAIKNGETLDSFGDVETALIDKADTTDIPTVPITAIQKNGTGITPVSGTVNITVPTQASDINAATATQGSKADTAIQGIKVNSSTVNPDANKVVNITVPTSAADVSALPDTTKYAAALSLTINPSTFVLTGQLKDQNGDNLGTAQTIDLPLESVVIGGSYNSQTKKVVLTLQNGNTIEFSVADLVSGLQTELSASNKLNPAYINYDSTHRAVSDTEKSTWNGKQNAIDSSHKLSADLVDDTSTTNKFATAAELEQIDVNKNNILLLANQGRKNVLKFDSVGGGDYSGITYTVNDDGTVRASGTASATSYMYLRINDLSVDVKEYTNGQFILSGCPSGGGSNTYSLYAAKGSYAKFDYGDGVTLTPTSETQVFVVLRVEKNQTVDIVFKPMIRLVGTDSTFEPYAPTNAELYEMIKALQS